MNVSSRTIVTLNIVAAIMLAGILWLHFQAIAP